MGFVAWLHGQALGDPKREMPYAKVYEVGPLIEAVLGMHGPFDLSAIMVAVREKYPDPYDQMEIGEAVAAAEATWRIDGLSMDVEDIGEDLEVAKYPCGFRSIAGIRCTHPAVAGAARCTAHGGAISDPEVRRSILLSSYARLMVGSENAVNALIEIVSGGRSEMARVQAAKELLDRAGLVQDQHVHLHVPTKGAAEARGGALETLRKRLDSVKERLELEPPMPYAAAGDDEVVDAEIVETDESA